MKKQLHYYALKQDLLTLLDFSGRKGVLRYTLMMNSTSPNLLTYLNGADVPNLGVARGSQGAACERFLITPLGISANIEMADGVNGVRRYGVSQRLNEDSVTIQLGGMWDGRIIISGRVATVSESPVAKNLMKQFEKAFRAASFTKVGHYLVGPEALDFLKKGGRLTIADQSPPEYDLKLT